jgi:hypothetical protein
MGSSNGKQNGEKKNTNRKSSFRRILHISSRQTNQTPRPVSYSGINQYCEEHQASNRPMSMFNVVSLDFLEETSIDDFDTIPIARNPISQSSSASM